MGVEGVEGPVADPAGAAAGLGRSGVRGRRGEGETEDVGVVPDLKGRAGVEKYRDSGIA